MGMIIAVGKLIISLCLLKMQSYQDQLPGILGSFPRALAQKLEINLHNLTGRCNASHYANTPMQYTAMFHGYKNFNFQMKNIIVFLFLLKTLIVGIH